MEYVLPGSCALVPKCIPKCPIGDIFIRGEKLKPKEDITPMESLRISIMLAILVQSLPGTNYDTDSYIKEHSLGRHFQ